MPTLDPMSLRHLLNQFQTVAFPPEFGFEAFTEEDIHTYWNAPSQFELRLKKAKQRHLLYSPAHCHIRQAFFNTLSQNDRVHLLESKLKFQNLPFQEWWGPLVDAHDIGMGHSVFRIQTTTHDIVLKQEDSCSQPFYMALLETLGWPYYQCFHHTIGHKGWEWADYLGNLSLSQALAQDPQHIALHHQLAQHAALGDFVGRGDRHFDNYMVKDGVVYPIDISYLFCQNHTRWLKKYLAGGLYELGVVGTVDPSHESDNLSRFITHYQTTLYQLFDRLPEVLRFVSKHGTCFEIDSDSISTYLTQHIQTLRHQMQSHLTLLIEGYFEMKVRCLYKQVLTQLLDVKPSLAQTYPLFKMYALADQNRPSSFFLVEDHPTVIPTLVRLANDYLGPQPWESWLTQLEEQKVSFLKDLAK